MNLKKKIPTCARSHVGVCVTEGTGPLIHNLSTKREVSGQLLAPAALPLGKSHQIIVDKHLGGLLSPSVRFEEGEDISFLSGFDTRFLGLLGAVLHCYHLIQTAVLSLALFIAACLSEVARVGRL